jgi:short-subunit dehydrogenase
MKLARKSALITGAGSGIGRAVAIGLAGAGMRVVLLGRRIAPLEQTADSIREAGSAAAVVAGDVADASARRRAVDTAVARFGGLDLLINNAGNVSGGRLENASEHDIRSMIEIDLVAPILLAREAMPELRKSGDAAIVNVSSGFGLVPMPFYAVYGAAKAGIAQFGEALRREFLGEGIHVMTVYPAVTDTPMMATSTVMQDLGVVAETSEEVARALIAGLEAGQSEVIRGGEARLAQIATQRERPWEIDNHLRAIKSTFEQAVSQHRSL